MTPDQRDRLLLLNQVAGPLFRELAEDLAKHFGRVTLVTGHTSDYARPLSPLLVLRRGPDYDRRSGLRRMITWMRFFAYASVQVARSDRRTPLLIVSNPPFLPLVGWLASLLRRQDYAIIVYDLYPGLLERLRRIRPGGLTAAAWHWLNRLTWARARLLITIGEEMAARMRAEMKTLQRQREVHVIANWADTSFVVPKAKAANAFAMSHDQVKKLTVLYAGNLGHAHDLASLLGAAAAMKDDARCEFLIVGDGAQRERIAQQVLREGLHNVRLLPFQPEADLPDLLATGDVAVVTFQRGAEGYMVPSKTYYALAAGSALLVIAREANEVSRLVEESGCGITVAPDDPVALHRAVRRFVEDPSHLAQCRHRARAIAERDFSRRNTVEYAELLAPMVEKARK